MPNSKKILLVSYGGAHYKIMSLLYKSLIQKFNPKQLIFLALTSAQKSCEEDEIKYKKLGNYDHLFDKKLINKIGNNLISKKEITLDFNESILYHGLSFFDLSNSFGSKKAYDLYAEHGRSAFMPIKTMESIIQYEAVDQVVSTDSPRFEQASLTAANNLNVKSICVPTLFGNREIADRLYQKTKSDIYRPNYDFAYVAHNKTKTNILKAEKKRKLDSIIVTGSPIFDDVIKQYTKNKKIKLNIDFSRYKIKFFYATQDYGNSISMLQEVLVPYFLNNKDKILIVKPHPGEDPLKYGFLNKYKNIEVILNENANNISDISDIIIVEDSTVGLEGILMKKKVLSISLDPLKRNNFRDFNLCDVVKSHYELKEYLNNLTIAMCNKNSYNEFYLYSSSVKKIVNFMEKEL
jgi:hypothetical protein